MAPLARVFFIHGRVQGVGFRWWTRSLANRLGIRGSVSNLPDGSVKVVAAGDDAVMVRLRDALGDGPPGSRVERIEEDTTNSMLPEGFEITG